jgi:ribonucleoside-diphosphate reductase alpha chain
MKREQLPNRRPHEGRAFFHGGIEYTLGIGAYGDGRLAEVFLATRRYGTAADTAARDASIAASLALQFGCPIETLRRALTRNGDGSPSGALGAALDLMARDAEVPA